MKYLLIIFSFFTFHFSQAQALFFAHNTGVTTIPETAFTKPLDIVPNAYLAFGLRRLNSSYTGPLCVATVVSTGATQDIYPTPQGHFDTTAWKTLCASEGDVLITELYNQSGIGPVKATLVAGYTGASVKLNNFGSRPTLNLNWSGSSRVFEFTTSLFSGKQPDITLAARVNATINSFGWSPFSIYNAQAKGISWSHGTSGSSATQKDVVFSTEYALSSSPKIFNWHIENGYSAAMFNATNYTSTVTPATIPAGEQNYRLYGMYHSSTYVREWNILGQVGEIIIYADPLTNSQRSDLRNNINSYYNIY